MEGYVITIDGGTTNTRCILWDMERRKIAEEKRQVGVRNTAIDGNNRRLKEAVRDCLEGLLGTGRIGYNQISRIIASGMITSDVGIVEIPHLTAPAGLEELARSVVPVKLEEIWWVPVDPAEGVEKLAEYYTYTLAG